MTTMRLNEGQVLIGITEGDIIALSFVHKQGIYYRFAGEQRTELGKWFERATELGLVCWKEVPNISGILYWRYELTELGLSIVLGQSHDALSEMRWQDDGGK